MKETLSQIQEAQADLNAKYLAFLQGLTANSGEFVDASLGVYINASVAPLAASFFRGLSKEEFDELVPLVAQRYADTFLKAAELFNQLREERQ